MIGFSLLAASMMLQAPAPVASAEQQVRSALQDYLRGQATGNADHYRRVFHPDARLHGVRDGRPEQRTLAEYLAMQSGRSAPDEAQRQRSIIDVRVSGDAAVATILLDYPRAITTDYMSMVREDGRWVIVHKLYNVESRRTPAATTPG